MRYLLEAEYEEFFSPGTMSNLADKSKQSLSQVQSSAQKMRQLLSGILEAEEGYEDELEMVAAQIVEDAYPVIKEQNIKIDAKIVKNVELPPPSEDEIPVQEIPDSVKAKRRIINGITQGASVRGAFAFLLDRKYLDQINPELTGNYNELLKSVFFGIYDDPKAVAQLLAMISNSTPSSGGSSEMVYDEDEGRFVIKARAICFPMLVHEIVKGLYEVLAVSGFGMDAEKNKAIIGQVDKVSNEPNDLRFGKFIYDALSKLYNESNIDDPRVREYFFTEVYQLDDDDFIPFIENAINDSLTPRQKKWAIDTMRDIERDNKNYDAESSLD